MHLVKRLVHYRIEGVVLTTVGAAAFRLSGLPARPQDMT
jgi:hypothetical protein